MNELDRDIALCTCLEVEDIRGKSKKKYENKISNAAFWFIWLDNFICGKAKQMDIIHFLFVYLIFFPGLVSLVFFSSTKLHIQKSQYWRAGKTMDY